MASFSISGLKRESCGGNAVMVLSLDGKQVFCFIGWMQHTRPDMLSLNSYGSKEILEVAKALAGFAMNRSYRISRFVPVMIEGDFLKQRAVVATLVTVPVETRNDYLLNLQAQAAYHAKQAQGFVIAALSQDEVYSGVADTYRERALTRQGMAAREFQRIAGVRGLFDTPSMDDSHAVDCNEEFPSVPSDYRETAFAAYGRYAMYCARASVSPYAFPEWFADCYMGHETDPAANWN